jgi:hypothetical protein
MKKVSHRYTYGLIIIGMFAGPLVHLFNLIQENIVQTQLNVHMALLGSRHFMRKKSWKVS